MMRLFNLVMLTLFVSIGFSQEHDVRLFDRFSKIDLDEMYVNQPAEYELLNIALERGISIGKIPTQKGKDIKFDGELDLDISEDHTYISLGIKLKEDDYQYFKITGTDMMVGVLPKTILRYYSKNK